MERNLTTGSIWKNIFYFSLPYLLSYFLQTLYGMADLFIIGQFDGAAGTTAVSIGSQVMHMITVIIVGLAMGTTVSIAQAVGAKDKKQASRCTGNTITLFLGVSVVLMVILLLLVKPIVLVMSTPFEAVSGTVAYLTICFIGIPFIIAYNIISSIFRGLGDSKSPMYFIAVACAANIALDYLFMGALHLGPSGAALGTTLSQTLSVILALIAIRKRDTGIRLTRSDLSPQTAVMGQILKIGVPIALQDGFIQIAFIIITIIANRRGLEAAAAVGIVEKIISFLFLVPSSLLSTVSALGAQNIGAGKPGRARLTLRYAAMIACSFGIAVVILTLFIAEPLVEITLIHSPALRLFWIDTALTAPDYSALELSTSRLAAAQAEALVFLGKVGFSVSQEHLNVGSFGQYDGEFLVLDEADRFAGDVIDLPASLCARVRFRGHHAESPAQYRRLMQFIREEGYTAAGFSREITVIDYGFTPDTEKFVTEIMIPLQKV